MDTVDRETAHRHKRQRSEDHLSPSDTTSTPGLAPSLTPFAVSGEADLCSPQCNGLSGTSAAGLHQRRCTVLLHDARVQALNPHPASAAQPGSSSFWLGTRLCEWQTLHGSKRSTQSGLPARKRAAQPQQSAGRPERRVPAEVGYVWQSISKALYMR